MDLNFFLESSEGAEGPIRSPAPWDVIRFSIADSRHPDRKQEILTPGIATAKCVMREIFDHQRGSGSDVGVLIKRGQDISRIDISVTVWTKEQWDLLVELAQLLWRKTHETPRNDLGMIQPYRGTTTIFAATAQDRQRASLGEQPAYGGMTPTGAVKGVVKTEQKKDKQAKIVQAAAVGVYHPALALYGIDAMVVTEMESPDVQPDGLCTVRFRGLQYAPPSEVNATRKIVGPGRGKVAQVREHQFPRNNAGPPVSMTDGLPSLRAQPGRGSY